MNPAASNVRTRFAGKPRLAKSAPEFSSVTAPAFSSVVVINLLFIVHRRKSETEIQNTSARTRPGVSGQGKIGQNRAATKLIHVSRRRAWNAMSKPASPLAVLAGKKRSQIGALCLTNMNRPPRCSADMVWFAPNSKANLNDRSVSSKSGCRFCGSEARRIKGLERLRSKVNGSYALAD